MGFELGDDAAEILDSLDYAVYYLASCLHTTPPLYIPTAVYIPEEISASWAAPANRGTSASWAAKVKRAHEAFPTATIEMVPGNHHTCITKYASVSADKMKKALGSLSPPEAAGASLAA
jgi:hypothetical protein